MTESCATQCANVGRDRRGADSSGTDPFLVTSNDRDVATQSAPSRLPARKVYRERVLVRVYDLGQTMLTRFHNQLTKNYGAFHTGVEVYGKEWSYGMTFDNTSGIISHEPAKNADHTFRETLSMGYTRFSPREVGKILEDLKREWRGRDYHVLTKNCHHFSEVFCARLAKIGAMGYINGETIVDLSAKELAALQCDKLTYCYGGGATIHDRALSEPKLIDVCCSFGQGCRVLVVGGNGAGKSTLLSIMGGKKMVPRNDCKILGKAAFHDSTLNSQRMYCGDWWRTDFFFNITVAELIGEKMLETPRVQELIDIMQINTSWHINAISDGQRRRCQLLECLAEEKKVYILDEITTDRATLCLPVTGTFGFPMRKCEDLDLYAREGLLRFLRRESEEKGATIFYATHIFDHLAEWATHLIFFSAGKVQRCCRMEDLHEYHQLAKSTRCPLYTLMKQWILQTYGKAVSEEEDASPPGPQVEAVDGPVLQTSNLTYSYAGGSPQLKNVSFDFGRGARILVVGANGAGKSTLLSILGGKRMIPRGHATVMGKDCFHDPGVSNHIMYCGDWWRTKFFMNLSIGALIGDVAKTPRAQHLAKVLQVDMEWKINEVSDGMRRRCQLLECLATPRSVYLMDEITSDLDLFAREGILNFLRAETETRGATIFYCTHIFDHLEGWASHLLHLSQGEVVKFCPMSEVSEYSTLCEEKNPTPLYSLVRRWIYQDYVDSNGAQPWRKLAKTEDSDEVRTNSNKRENQSSRSRWAFAQSRVGRPISDDQRLRLPLAELRSLTKLVLDPARCFRCDSFSAGPSGRNLQSGRSLLQGCWHMLLANVRRVARLPPWINTLAATGADTLDYLDSTDSGYDGGEAIVSFFDNIRTSVFGFFTDDGNHRQTEARPSVLPHEAPRALQQP
eukprot:s2340_g21.t4